MEMFWSLYFHSGHFEETDRPIKAYILFPSQIGDMRIEFKLWWFPHRYRKPNVLSFTEKTKRKNFRIRRIIRSYLQMWLQIRNIELKKMMDNFSGCEWTYEICISLPPSCLNSFGISVSIIVKTPGRAEAVIANSCKVLLILLIKMTSC